DIAAYVESTQRHVTGTVRVKLLKGNASVVGRKSPKSLYSFRLATYDKGDEFDQSASLGFIHIWGLPVKIQAQIQGWRSLGLPVGTQAQIEGAEQTEDPLGEDKK
ncbi:unnamed protein product, partial [marine sediment metagenome]